MGYASDVHSRVTDWPSCAPTSWFCIHIMGGTVKRIGRKKTKKIIMKSNNPADGKSWNNNIYRTMHIVHTQTHKHWVLHRHTHTHSFYRVIRVYSIYTTLVVRVLFSGEIENSYFAVSGTFFTIHIDECFPEMTYWLILIQLRDRANVKFIHET